jgi:hypothetical protein
VRPYGVAIAVGAVEAGSGVLDINFPRAVVLVAEPGCQVARGQRSATGVDHVVPVGVGLRHTTLGARGYTAASPVQVVVNQLPVLLAIPCMMALPFVEQPDG